MDEDVDIPVAGTALPGHVTLPAGARGIVLFAHGSGSSRHSPRNRYVATVLQEARPGHAAVRPAHPARGGATAPTSSTSTCWPSGSVPSRSGPCASLGRRPAGGLLRREHRAAAALAAAATRTRQIAAVVSRGGRPDLAIPVLDRVHRAHAAHRRRPRRDGARAQPAGAAAPARARSSLAVVPGATHLFEEPGTLAQAARLARDWFLDHLAGPGSATPTDWAAAAQPPGLRDN